MPKVYPPEIVEQGLQALVLCGGSGANAAKALDRIGVKVPERTLYDWRESTHRDRYVELSKQYGTELEAIIATKTREVAFKAQDVTLEALNRTHEKLKANQFDDPSAVARNAGVTGAVAIDKLLAITGRPQVIVQHRSSQEVIEQAEKENPDLIITATHEEITDAELAEGSPEPDLFAESRPSNALVPARSAGADT